MNSPTENFKEFVKDIKQEDVADSNVMDIEYLTKEILNKVGVLKTISIVLPVNTISQTLQLLSEHDLLKKHTIDWELSKKESEFTLTIHYGS